MVACGRHKSHHFASPGRPQLGFWGAVTGPGDASRHALAQALTDSTIKGIRPPKAGRIEVADLRCAGLAFRVTSANVRSWCFRFRDPQTGKDARSTIGRYPDISLGKARQAADGLRGKVADGINPVKQKRSDRADASGKAFRVLADRYLDEHARRFKRSHAADEASLRLHILPKWSRRRFDQIERTDVIELVEGIVRAGFPVQANRVQA